MIQHLNPTGAFLRNYIAEVSMNSIDSFTMTDVSFSDVVINNGVGYFDILADSVVSQWAFFHEYWLSFLNNINCYV